MRIHKNNVCVVGGAGFLGSHLVHYLFRERECNVLVVDNLVTGRREFLPSSSKVHFEHFDITGSESYLQKLFAHHCIDYVFNYAAEPYIPVSFERPLHVCNTNFFGAAKVINAAQEAGCKGILQVSSAEIYGEQQGQIDETATVIPHSSYGASKAAIDFLVQARWREAKTPCIALRQFNCVGERETHPYVVPEIISQIHRASTLNAVNCKVRLGNNSTRDFQYAGDAVKMAVSLLESERYGEVFNLGSESTIKIYALAKLIGKCMGKEVIVIPDLSRVRPWEIWHLQSDNTKIHNTITTRAEVTLVSAIRKTVQYFHDNGSKWSWE